MEIDFRRQVETEMKYKICYWVRSEGAAMVLTLGVVCSGMSLSISVHLLMLGLTLLPVKSSCTSLDAVRDGISLDVVRDGISLDVVRDVL